MSNERRQILDMLSEGKIDADQAEKLLAALETHPERGEEAAEEGDSGNGFGRQYGRKPKFLHVKVDGDGSKHGGHEHVDIKVPLMLLKAGMKFKGLVPEKLRDKMSSKLGEHGVSLNLDAFDSDNIDELISALGESAIEVEADGEKVRIYCA